MTNKSRIYTFLNKEKGLSLLVFDGRSFFEKFWQGRPKSSASVRNFFHQTILSLQPLINFLKPTEHLGIYLHSQDNPSYRFHLEMFEKGQTRSLITPSDFSEMPSTFTGDCRLVKFLPYQHAPYQSILSLSGVQYSEIIRQIFLQSYQFDCDIVVNAQKQKSIFIFALPQDRNTSPHSIPQFQKEKEPLFEQFFHSDISSVREMAHLFEQQELDYQSSKVVDYVCHCSRERYLKHVYSLGQEEVSKILREDKLIQVTCDYCQTNYTFYDSDFVWQ